MIKIKKTDTIIDIIGKINEEKNERIILDFPLWHPILHNHISLKILKNHCGKKDFTIITPDISSRTIGKSLGINYSFIKDPAFHEEKNKKGNLLKHNFSFWEYFFFEIKKSLQEFKKFFYKNKSIKYYSLKYEKQKSRIGLFLLWLFISFFIFVFIFYFAVPKSYITITPEVKVKSRGRNFIFRETNTESSLLHENIIPLTAISNTISLSETFATTGIDETKINRAKWKISVFNTLNEEIKLVPNTRFQSNNGTIFSTEEWIVIPAWNDENPWKINIFVSSQIKDNKGNIITQDANIKMGEMLIIPALDWKLKEQIYAKAVNDFIGADGSDNAKIISEEDIENAKALFTEKLKKKALDALKQKIKEENMINNVTYEILWVNEILNYENINIHIWEDAEIGARKNKFTLSGNITIKSYIYNKDLALTKLKKIVNESILEESEQVLLIDEKSLYFSTELYRKNSPFEIKSTLNVDALIVHNFLNENDAYVQKLKSTILWLQREEAIKLLLNDEKVSNVEIYITPFFIDTISSINDNIIFKVNEKL